MGQTEAKVQLYIASSLDGFIAPLDGSVDWLSPYPVEELGFENFYAGVGSIVMGRITYEQACSFGDWNFADKKTVVLSRTQPPPEPVHPSISFDSGDLPALCTALKRSTPGNVWLMGGGKTIRSFLQAELVDELLLFVLPVLLGSGIPLFLDTGKPIPWASVNVRRFGSGVVLLHYTKL